MKKVTRKTVKYAKPNFIVTQKNLTAQWAFPVSRFEEFLSLFHQAVYDVAVQRLSDTKPIENPKGEKHSKDARLLVSAISNAMLAATGYRSTPYYCDVDYFFWIVGGMVCFGCVLPSSETIQGLEYRTWKHKGKRMKFGLPWVRTPWEIVRKGKRLSGKCPDGAIPSYVRLLSFHPSQTVGVQEFARRMVHNPKEREWAVQYAMRTRTDDLREKRQEQVARDIRACQMRMGGAGVIADERYRQIHEEGFTAARDDSYVKGELARAAMAYAEPGVNSKSGGVISMWPATWDIAWWKPSDDPVRNLIRAGALIAAEIDRHYRLRVTASPSPAKVMQEVIKREVSGV